MHNALKIDWLFKFGKDGHIEAIRPVCRYTLHDVVWEIRNSFFNKARELSARTVYSKFERPKFARVPYERYRIATYCKKA